MGRDGSPGLLREPFSWLSLVVLAAFVPVLIRLPALGDLFLHAGTIQQLRLHLSAPLDPMTGMPSPGNPYFSPWAVGWAEVARVTGWDVFVVLRLAGAVNLVLVLAGFRTFVRTLTRNPWAPVTAFLAVCFLWGAAFFYWSGFISLPTLVAGIAYPSTFAVGVTLLLWAGLNHIVRPPWRTGHLALALALGLGGALVALSHPFTGLGAGAYAVAVVLTHADRIRPRTWAALLLGAAVGAAVVAVWPWYHLLSATADIGGFDSAEAALSENLVARYVLLLVAVPALAWRLHVDHRDALAWTVAAGLCVFVAGIISGLDAVVRIFAMVALLSQVAVGIIVAEWLLPGRAEPRVPTRAQRLYAGAAGLAILAGVVFQSGVVNLYSPGSYPAALDRVFHSRMSKGDYRWLAAHVPTGATVMTADWDTRAMTPAYGIFTVQPAWPDPFLGSAEGRRIADTRRFFDATTTTRDRVRLLERYRTRWVVVTTDSAAPFADDPHFELVASRPPSGPREEGPGGPAQLFRLVRP